MIPEASSSVIYTGTATVVNNPCVLLPDTGGSGDTFSTDLGIMLLAFGLMMLLKESRGKNYQLRLERRS